MLASKRLLQGGTYTHDFLEVNPPMILYLFAPAVLLNQLFALPVYIGLRIYVFGLAALSLWICSRLSWPLFTFAIAVMFLILPVGAMGQREQLFIILAMPYLLLTTNRIKQKNQLTRTQAMGIGVLAGLGFALKPYFLLSFGLVEAYVCWRKRSLWAWIRPETLSIALVAVVYFVVIALFQRDYLTVVLPIITKVYYHNFGMPMTVILRDDLVFFSGFSLLFFAIRYRFTIFKPLGMVLALTALGLTIAFVIQRTSWYYHMLPALCMDCLLCFLLFAEMAYQKTFTRFEVLSTSLLMAALLIDLVVRIPYIYVSLLFFPLFYFSYFTLLFAGLLWLAIEPRNPVRLAASMLLIIGLGALFNLCGAHSIWRMHMFSLTTLLLTLLFILCIPNKTPPIKFKFSFLMALGMLLFAYPYHKAVSVYQYSEAAVKFFKPLQTVLNAYPKASVMFFTNSSDFAFPTLDYTHQTFVGRFSAMGWLPNLVIRDDNQTYQAAYQTDKPMMDFFIGTVVEDIETYKPDLILIDVRETDPRTKIGYFGNEQMDYVRFFSLYTPFQSTWKMYHLVHVVDGQPAFKFKIYARNPKSPATPQ